MGYSLNAPCPCGSGKKYKRCCVNKKAVTATPKPKVTKHPLLGKLVDGNSHHLLTSLAGLQLHALNHGKNVRLEQLVTEYLPLFEAEDGKPTLNYGKIKHVVENYKDGKSYEDPPLSPFTENVIFIGGNFTVLPGIASAQSELLGQLLFCTMTNRALPENFRSNVGMTAGAMLILSDMIAEKAGLGRYETVDNNATPRDIDVPDAHRLEALAKAVTIDKQEYEDRCHQKGYEPTPIKQFLIDVGDPAIGTATEDPYITRKMVLETHQTYICVGPTTIVSGLVHYIYEQADLYNTRDELMADYYQGVGVTVNEAFLKMGLRPVEVPIPAAPPDLAVLDNIFQFDRQKYAHICIVQAQGADTKAIAAHADRVAQAIKAGYKPGDAEVFTIYVFPEIGMQLMFSINEAPNADHTLYFTLSELEAVAYHKDTDNLTLWKFAKAYKYARSRTGIINTEGLLEAYVTYYENQGSILPSDDAVSKGGALLIPMAGSAGFRQKVKVYRDEHSILKYGGSGLVTAMVRRYRGYGPIFFGPRTEHELALALDLYDKPIWAISEQESQGNNDTLGGQICEAALFWLMKMQGELQPWLEGIDLPVIEINVTVDDAVVDPGSIDSTKVDRSDTNIVCTSSDRKLDLYVPAGILDLTAAADNRADRALMTAVLTGLNGLPRSGALPVLTDVEMVAMIERTMVPPNAKMLLYVDVIHNIRVDPRNLPNMRYLQDADVSMVLDQMVGWLGAGYAIPEKIDKAKDKVQVINDVVSTLNQQLTDEINKYNGTELIEYLVTRNEKAIQTREFREVYIPARIACFSSFKEELDKFKKQGKLLVPTALAYRSLIEYVASKPPRGNKRPNVDNVDYLVALMDAVNDWGTLSDTIHLKLDDPEMGLLPSGRIGVDKTFDRTFNERYRHARMETEVFKIQEDFNDVYLPTTKTSTATPTKESLELDAATAAEFGITLTQLAKLFGVLVDVGIADGKPCVSVDEATLVAMLVKAIPELPEEQIRATLDLLSLQQRPQIDKPVAPYKYPDIAPWRYNRSLSYLRRPLVRMQEGNKQVYRYGYRHLFDVLHNLQAMIGMGKLIAQSAAMKTFMGEMTNQRGKEFSNAVRQWFVDHTDFYVVSHEVKIEKGKHLDADKNYGDVDVLVVDKTNKIIYPLECKAIYGARNAFEMKSEVDRYLGTPGKEAEARIGMHVARDQWLHDNYDKLAAFLKLDDTYQIRSMMVTAEPIPLPLLKELDMKLPFTDYVKLRMKGTDALK